MSYNSEIKSTEQKPFAELYQFSTGQSNYYYTSYETPITYLSQIYQPAAIKRSAFSFDDKISAARCKITMFASSPLKQYISNSPIEPTRIKITRVFPHDLTAVKVIFDGEVIRVTITKDVCEADCESVSVLFRNKLPNIVYQSYCNHALFDAGCGINKETIKTRTSVTVSGSTLVASAFDALADGYFTGGHVVTDYGDARLITNHVGNTITLQVPFDARLVTGANVNAFPGCDKSVSTCIAKFNNKNNFLGFPYIPSNNPVLWGFDK